MSRGVLDTSFLIAPEQAPFDLTLPDEVAVSVVTIAELEVGVLNAPDGATRAQRLRTLTEARVIGAALPIDERVASIYAELVVAVRAKGRKPRVNDTWIAATALASAADVWTRDADFTDFDAAVRVVRV